MFGGKLSYLNKEHMRSKIQTKAGADDLINRATRVVAKHLHLEYVAVVPFPILSYQSDCFCSPANLPREMMQKALLLGTVSLLCTFENHVRAEIYCLALHRNGLTLSMNCHRCIPTFSSGQT